MTIIVEKHLTTIYDFMLSKMKIAWIIVRNGQVCHNQYGNEIHDLMDLKRKFDKNPFYYNTTGIINPFGFDQSKVTILTNDDFIGKQLKKIGFNSIFVEGSDTDEIIQKYSDNIFESKINWAEIKAKHDTAYKEKEVQCPHCGKKGIKGPGMNRWHFDNCRNLLFKRLLNDV